MSLLRTVVVPGGKMIQRLRRDEVGADSDAYDPATGRLTLVVNRDHVAGFEIHSGYLPYREYTINSRNNTFVANVGGGGDTTVTLTQQNYTITQLTNHIQARLIADTGEATFTATHDTQTNKVTIAATPAFTLSFAAKPLLGYNLGFAEAVASTTSAVGTAPVDLQNARHVNVECDLLEHYYRNTPVISRVSQLSALNDVGNVLPDMRLFTTPVNLNTITINLKAKYPRVAGLGFYDNNGTFFELFFSVYSWETLPEQSTRYYEQHSS